MLALCGCGGPSVRLAGGSQEAEREVGEQLAKYVHDAIGLSDDRALAAYVSEVGDRLARQAQRGEVQYRFEVVDMVAPNAFALPDGHVYVSRGLLALMNSEDELAGVMGHEIAHVEARHAVKRSQAKLAIAPVQFVAGLTGALASLISSNLGAGIAAAGEFFLAPYSREQEREADRIGQELAAKAGWRAQGLTTALETLDREERREGGGPRADGFLATHPSTPGRVAETARRAAKLVPAPAQPVAGDRAPFLAKLDGLLVGDNPTHGVFVDTRFLHPVLGLRMEFPDKWWTGRAPGGVGAISPDEREVMLLRPVAVSDDPLAVARVQEKRAGVRLLDNARELDLNGLAAVQSEVQVRGTKENYWLLLTWVKLGRVVYLIIGIAPQSRAESFGPIMRRSVATFGVLSEAERAAITVTVLRTAQAQAGETLAGLSQRTGSVWDAELIAIANGLRKDVVLQGDELIKVAVKQPI
jgi:predicted Zn-dependent protease